MSPQLYYAVMLITNPQKARRILLAEELEDWFMDLFEDEFVDIMNGTFKDKQETYIDRIVNEYFNSIIDVCTCPKDFPVCVCGNKPLAKYISKKPINPSEEEINENPRSKSAHLRVIEKI